jgi:transcriptional regulator with XRE-family HTH domain
VSGTHRARVGEPVATFDPEALRALRHARGLSHDQLGEAVGMNRPTLIAYEQKRRRPGIAAVVALAGFFDVDPLELTTSTLETATLADLRTRAGLTKTAVAENLGLGRSTWDQVERGRRTLQPYVATRLAALLDVSVSQVLAAHERGPSQPA